MKHLKDLQEISRLLAASPDLPAPNGGASIVQADVLINRLEQLVSLGMGLPLAQFVDSQGVYLRLAFSSIGEECTLFVPTNRPGDFLKEMRGKLVATI